MHVVNRHDYARVQSDMTNAFLDPCDRETHFYSFSTVQAEVISAKGGENVLKTHEPLDFYGPINY
jgi:hypothetical protein